MMVVVVRFGVCNLWPNWRMFNDSIYANICDKGSNRIAGRQERNIAKYKARYN